MEESVQRDDEANMRGDGTRDKRHTGEQRYGGLSAGKVSHDVRTTGFQLSNSQSEDWSC